jgi:hypothetical protein
MPIALSVLEKRFDIVVVQPGTISHVNRMDSEFAGAGLCLSLRQGHPEQIVQGVSKRGSSRPAFVLDPLDNIIIERDCRTDAHDVLSLASKASPL